MLGSKKLFAVVAVLMIVAMVVSACGPRGEKAASQINLNLAMDPPTADPALVTHPTSVQVVELLFLGLTDFDEDTMDVMPELATRWTLSDDGLTWTLKMREDASWVHYDPASSRFTKKGAVTAHDVEYGVKRALNPQTASDYAYVLYAIKNAEAYNTGEITDPTAVGVRARDDYTVEFTLEQPAGYFPAIAGMWVSRPVPKAAIEQHGDKWTEPGNIWTNGPYALAVWERENRMVMVKNPHYYDARNVSIERINWSMVTDESASFAMYESGELDSVAVPPSELDRVRADPVLSKELHTAPEICTYYLGFNNSKPPLDNKLVRQALSYAIDRDKLIQTMLKGGQKPAQTFTCPGIFGSPAGDPAFEGIAFDPEKARALLAAAGYPAGEGWPEVTYLFNTFPTNQRIAEFVVQSWKEILGIDVNLAGQEWRAYHRTLREDPPQIYHLVWCADYPDAHNWLFEVFHSTESENRIVWSNAEYDKAVEDAAAEPDPGKRKELYFRAEQILCVEEAGIAPIYHYVRNTVSKPYVERTYSPLGGEHVDRWKVHPR
jgi:oligopeptide transport system substrate-binding protein